MSVLLLILVSHESMHDADLHAVQILVRVPSAAGH
jgi:hypothetical protein